MQQEPPKVWGPAIAVAAAQIFLAIFAVFSSSRDILSDGACVGGLVGSLGTLALLAPILVALLVLAWKSRKAGRLHYGVKPLLLLVGSSAIAFPLSMSALLHCTV
ncbi:hypothetical protein [Jannaschia seohaensis]|uniref:Uncharacterized protein n=1 Tax=Jannaschia seohaensis TaxID=475081 RepID=A0A2Y9ATY2_9RHOB|nr:hypothetical protein [Jannaschia seohaensis]PWJ19305.1 hypothetical protein BCF38_104239 [Jannaschia seohaensis]SSA45967.1 hypothetical protein SAMN05421539_104239 [Jannaschia seohaensis]